MKNNYLVSVCKDGKVVGLYYSEYLYEMQTIRTLHRDCSIEVIQLNEVPNRPVRKQEDVRVPGRKPLRCVETGEVYSSVSECSRKTGIPVVSIYESVRWSIAAYGYHFEYIRKNG